MNMRFLDRLERMGRIDTQFAYDRLMETITAMPEDEQAEAAILSSAFCADNLEAHQLLIWYAHSFFDDIPLQRQYNVAFKLFVSVYAVEYDGECLEEAQNIADYKNGMMAFSMQKILEGVQIFPPEKQFFCLSELLQNAVEAGVKPLIAPLHDMLTEYIEDLASEHDKIYARGELTRIMSMYDVSRHVHMLQVAANDPVYSAPAP